MSSDTVVFMSERLVCRRWQDNDFRDVLGLYSDPLAMKFVDDGSPLSEPDCHKWFKITSQNYSARGYGMLKLSLRESPGSFIGCIGLVHPNKQVLPELKYALIPEVWGRGYATEAVSALLEYARSMLSLGRMIATVHPHNQPSQRVLEKCGFVVGLPRVNSDGTETLVYEYPQESAL